MKKIMTLAAAMLLTATAAMAQFSAGIGYLTPNHPWTDDGLNGFYASVDYNIPIVGNLGVAPGIAYSFSGKKTMPKYHQTYVFHKASLREQYVSVPVNVNYALNLSSDLTVRLYAGPTFSYGLTSIFKGDIDIKDWTIVTGKHIGHTINLYNDSGDYKKFDILVGGGVAFDYDSSIRLSLGYNYGLLNRYNTTLIPSFHRSYLHMGIAYLF